MKTYLTLILLLLSAPLTAAQFEKSRLKADNSYLDASTETPTVVYENNVVYQHGQMTIEADKLIKQGEDAGTITAEGHPLRIHYVDKFGETTDIEAPKISYKQKTGELAADGDITIVQTSKNDTLTLIGNKLRANQRITDGFSFVLTGAPTQFILKQPNQTEITAEADTLRSNGKDRKTQLVGSVKLSQGSSNTTAALLTYDGETKRISADQSADGSQQVVTEFYWEDDAGTEKTETEKALEQEPASQQDATTQVQNQAQDSAEDSAEEKNLEETSPETTGLETTGPETTNLEEKNSEKTDLEKTGPEEAEQEETALEEKVDGDKQ